MGSCCSAAADTQCPTPPVTCLEVLGGSTPSKRLGSFLRGFAPNSHPPTAASPRPDDYFVEMQKTDNHMYKVREVLEKQRQQVMEKEERRKRKYMQKIGKHTEAQIVQERQKKKKEMLRKVEEFKKKRKVRAAGCVLG